jgi:hypothetical protein
MSIESRVDQLLQVMWDADGRPTGKREEYYLHAKNIIENWSIKNIERCYNTETIYKTAPEYIWLFQKDILYIQIKEFSLDEWPFPTHGDVVGWYDEIAEFIVETRETKPGLSKYMTDEALPFLIEDVSLCDYTGIGRRRVSAFALGEIGDERAVPALIQAMEWDAILMANGISYGGDSSPNPNWWIFDAAVKALGKIGDKRAIKPIEDCLKHVCLESWIEDAKKVLSILNT